MQGRSEERIEEHGDGSRNGSRDAGTDRGTDRGTQERIEAPKNKIWRTGRLPCLDTEFSRSGLFFLGSRLGVGPLSGLSITDVAFVMILKSDPFD